MWLTVILWIILISAAVLQAFRGFGRAIFDTLCLYAALWCASASTHAAAGAIHLSSDPDSNHAGVFAALFVVYAVLGILVSRYVYSMTHFHLGMMEALLGLCAGIGAGIILCHAVTCVVNFSGSGNGLGQSLVAQSPIGHELYSFDSFHSTMTAIEDSTGGPMKTVPDYSH